MTRQTPAELAAEQDEEVADWLLQLNQDRYRALVDNDYATIAHLHKALARVMGNYQRFRKERDGDSN